MFKVNLYSEGDTLKKDKKNQLAVYDLYPDLSSLVINFTSFDFSKAITEFDYYAVIKDKTGNLQLCSTQLINGKLNVIIKDRQSSDIDELEVWFHDATDDTWHTLGFTILLKYRQTLSI